MQPAEVYAWLTAIPNLGCDGFDAHVTASILALSLWEAETGRLRPTDAIGLDGKDLVALARDMFPHAATVFSRWESEAASPPTEDEACLRELLRRNVTHGTEFQCRLADMIARRCLRPNHLWQDLGLRNRRELGWLLLRHFEPLAARNRTDMKWKKFFTAPSVVTKALCSAPPQAAPSAMTLSIALARKAAKAFSPIRVARPSSAFNYRPGFCRGCDTSQPRLYS